MIFEEKPMAAVVSNH